MVLRLECTRVNFVQVSVLVPRDLKKGLDNNTVYYYYYYQYHYNHHHHYHYHDQTTTTTHTTTTTTTTTDESSACVVDRQGPRRSWRDTPSPRCVVLLPSCDALPRDDVVVPRQPRSPATQATCDSTDTCVERHRNVCSSSDT